MEKLHFVSGFPRSGSTLLCNLLNMNERPAISKKCLAGIVRSQIIIIPMKWSTTKTMDWLLS